MRSLIALAFFAVATVGMAQVMITDGTSSFGWSSNANLTGAAVRTGSGGGTGNTYTVNGSSDQAFQEWWWYRVNGVNSREFALSNQSAAPVISGNNMILAYREPEGFTSTLHYTINNTPGGALVTGTNFIKNEGNVALSLSLFNYIDYDIGGTATGDRATMLSPNPATRWAIFDPAVLINAEYRAIDASNYQVTAFPVLRGSLTDTGVTTLNNTGLPFGAGDFTGGLEWQFTLDPNQEIALQTSRLLNPVPEPATMAILGLGAAALLKRRRAR